MGRAQVYSILFYLHLVVESRNTLPAQIYIYKFIYIYAHTYTCICANIYIYIYTFMREGGSSNAEAQNHDLSRKVIRPEQLSWPRTW